MTLTNLIPTTAKLAQRSAAKLILGASKVPALAKHAAQTAVQWASQIELGVEQECRQLSLRLEKDTVLVLNAQTGEVLLEVDISHLHHKDSTSTPPPQEPTATAPEQEPNQNASA